MFIHFWSSEAPLSSAESRLLAQRKCGVVCSQNAKAWEAWNGGKSWKCFFFWKGSRDFVWTDFSVRKNKQMYKSLAFWHLHGLRTSGLNEFGSRRAGWRTWYCQIVCSILTARMADVKEYDLQNHRHLIDFLIDANIRLVRGEYLHYLAREKRLWPRRQEAEHETFEDKDGSVKTALVTIEEYKKQGYKFVLSVSHCWEAKQHPDPFGFQVQSLLSKMTIAGLYDCWAFVDFICLPQYYRTPQEQVFFKRAMANMHALYAHRSVLRVLRLEHLADESAKASPPNFIEIYYEEAGAEPGSGKFGPQPFSKLELNDTPYHERGWCEAEKQWMCTKEDIEGYAPMTPARFRERIERGHQNLPDGLVLKFTHRSDEEIVVKLQEKIFLQQTQRRKRLHAFRLPESELLLLAESSPHFVNLQVLTFSDLEIREESAVTLVVGLKTLRHLKELDFTSSCSIDEKTATVLANGLLECQFAREFKVDVPNTSGTLHNELIRRLSTRRVKRRSDRGFVIKPGCRQCWPFGCLWRQLAMICS